MRQHTRIHRGSARAISPGIDARVVAVSYAWWFPEQGASGAGMICPSWKGEGAVFTLILPVSACNNCDGSGGFLVDMGSRPCPACEGKGLTRLTG